MAGGKNTVLIIEDDLDVAEMLNAYFRIQGYEVLTADWGETGVQTAVTSEPDLIILDIRLPDIDGFEVAARLRANRRTQAIPIIFLTDKRQRVDRIKGLTLGADDYITKPFDIQELRLRVRNALRRAAQGPPANPITNLPEGEVVDEHLRQVLDDPNGWSLLVARIENLDSFREDYGFVASDDVLRAISVLIERAAGESISDETFVGHLSASEFVLAVPAGKREAISLQISKRLAQSVELFYPVDVREGAEPIANRIRVKHGSLGPPEIRASTGPDDLKKRLVATIA
ncbi:MAG TPA: response regulator [Anaerolineales bacterium]|nr:response regulator [Anaerolineales bacterium]